MKVLLVCSTGGHLAQLYSLRGWWDLHEHVWVTFDQEDARSMLDGERSIWAYHPTTRNLWNLVRNFGLALRTVRRERPEVVVSTGAGVAVPFFAAAKLFGARTVFVEVIDRVDQLTLTARLCRPFTDLFLVQWERQRDLVPEAHVVGRLLFDREMMSRFDDVSPFSSSSEPTVFVTLGMDHHPFRRLVQWSNDFGAEFPGHRLMVQHGPEQAPNADRTWPFLPFGQLIAAIKAADVIVTHGGPGTIGLALALGKKPVVMPRLAKLGEVVDDHQVAFARFMADQNLIHLVETTEDLTTTVRGIMSGDLDGNRAPADGSEQSTDLNFGHLVDEMLAPA